MLSACEVVTRLRQALRLNRVYKQASGENDHHFATCMPRKRNSIELMVARQCGNG